MVAVDLRLTKIPLLVLMMRNDLILLNNRNSHMILAYLANQEALVSKMSSIKGANLTTTLEANTGNIILSITKINKILIIPESSTDPHPS